MGWCYQAGYSKCEGANHPPTSAMTAGGVGALIIYDYLLGLDWSKDVAVKEGIAWLDQSFTFKENGTSRVTCPPRRRDAQFMVIA